MTPLVIPSRLLLTSILYQHTHNHYSGSQIGDWQKCITKSLRNSNSSALTTLSFWWVMILLYSAEIGLFLRWSNNSGKSKSAFDPTLSKPSTSPDRCEILSKNARITTEKSSFFCFKYSICWDLYWVRTRIFAKSGTFCQNFNQM